MVRAATVDFKCPHCDALYQIVKAEAGPETSIDGEIPCRAMRDRAAREAAP